MDNRKEQERAELHRTIWGIANDLRGSVDGWDFKQYVLGMLLYRYISENITAFIDADEHASDNKDFSYAAIEAFALGTASEDNFSGLFDELDGNSNKLGGTVSKRNERFVKLMNGISEMKLGDYKDNTIDVFVRLEGRM